jgi:hypothetical protein
MKKHLVVVLSMLFVLGFAAPSFAIHAAIPGEVTDVVAPRGTEIRLGGEIRVRGWWQDNITTPAGVMARTGRPYASPHMGWYDQRVRLFVNVRTAPNVTGRILLETESVRWGTDDAVDAEVVVREAWVAYTGTGLLGVPSGIRLGRMPLDVGERTFFDRRVDGENAILLWVEPAKGTDINFVAAKLEEGTIRVEDDLDLYSLMLTHRLDKDNTIGANLSLERTSDITVTPYTRTNLWNAGLLARGKVADIGYRATVDFQFGGISNLPDPPPTNVDFRGWGATVGASYKIDPVTLRANFVYGSGDDIATDDRYEGFQTRVDAIIDPNLPTVVYNNRVITAMGDRGTGIANTTAYNLGITFSPIKGMTTHIDYYFLRASQRLSAVPNELGHSRNIGSELTLRKTYTIARGLTYSINAGILFAGDFYRDTAVSPVRVPENAKVFQHAIVFAF